jgi:hypothetical protein
MADHDANLVSLRAEKELVEITKFSEKREGWLTNYKLFNWERKIPARIVSIP